MIVKFGEGEKRRSVGVRDGRRDAGVAEGRGIPAADGEQQVSGWRGTSAHVVSVSLRCSLTARGMDGRM